jgi:multidrug efflux pump subunit AcrA (membrane-fusion protein)
MIHKLSLSLCLALALTACSSEPQIKHGHLLKVESKKLSSTLFYSGIIQPLHTVVIPSPADAAVTDIDFQYGDQVKAGQLLFKLSSTKFMSDYKTALTNYIKAKTQFNDSQNQLREAAFLHKNELISDDEYNAKKSAFFTTQLELIQSKDVLKNLIAQLDIKDINIYDLTITDIDKIDKAMHLQTSAEYLRVVAPTSGVVLSAMKNEDESKKILKGDVVKQGDVLAIIGDMTGLSTRIKVNEMTVNQLKVGQKIHLTGIAFPDQILDGEVKRLDRQGEATNGSLPTFPVEIVVPRLSPLQQKLIHVGMTAKIEILVDEDPQISIPISAIKEKDDVAYVQRYDETTQRLKEVPISTGRTTIDSVVVLAGLKPGDRIVVPN